MTTPDNADNLLGKADALLGRYRASPPAAATPPSDFPVLTEVVELPPGQTVTPPPLETPTLPEPVTQPLAAAMPLDEDRLRDEILATIGPELEQRLADTLKPRAVELLDWATQTVQQELSLSIRAAVRSAVAQAVDEALDKRRAPVQDTEKP